MSSIFKWLTSFFFVEEAPVIENYYTPKESASPTVKHGVVTFISDDYGLIDNKLYFEANAAPKSLKLTVGDEVKYSSLKVKDNESEKIVRIYERRESFEDEVGKEEDAIKPVAVEPIDSMERVMNGKIAVKQEKDLFIHPLNIYCSLDNVKCDFVPIEGDWVSVAAEVSTDSDAFNLAGEILHIKCLKPLLVRKGRGSVTHVNNVNGQNCRGVIEDEICYSSDYCQIDFVCSLGEQVKYEAVASDQGKYKWRALLVQPTGDRDELIMEKNNMTIEGNLTVGPLEVGETQEIRLTVKNGGKSNQVITKSSFMSRKSRSQLRLKSPDVSRDIVIEAGESVEFTFECTAKFLGMSNELFVFHFKNFKIARCFVVNVVFGRQIEKLMSQGNNENDKVPQNRTYLWKNFNLSDATFAKRDKNVSKAQSRFGTSVNRYPIPENLFKIVLGEGQPWTANEKANVKAEILKYAPCLMGTLDEKNYVEKFHMLLYLEEISEKISYRKYDLFGVILRKRDCHLTLDVSKTLNADNVFSVGMSVVVTQPWSEVNTGKQVGYIRENRNGILFIDFHNIFHSTYDESKCDVFFQPARTTFVRCHQAVNLAVARLGMNWLFPTKVNEKPPLRSFQLRSDNLSLTDLECDVDENGYVIPRNDNGDKDASDYDLKWFNPSLNALQKAAVVNILEGKCRPLPYVIFGPPGTGKTVTIVEVVLQVFTLVSDSRILIGAPSNSAADIITHYLITTGKFTPGELVRILARSRACSGDVPENLIPYCSTVTDYTVEAGNRNHQNIRVCDTSEVIGMERVVIATCNTIGALHSFDLNQGHFSHIIIDEAAKCFEPEALIPISFLDPKRGQVVLSGDTEQLGPICTGFKDNDYDLSRSFLGRLTSARPYVRDVCLYPRTGGFDPRCITRLRINYRSVPEILNLPSQLFYDSELIPTVSQEAGPEAEIIRRFNFATETRDKPPAIIFHAIRGQTYQEQNSFSWYNPLEMWQSICYLKRLYAIDLTPEHVGIITPYQKQVQKLRLLLSALNVPMPKIGSVEEFQGQERYAIILSTVRSSTRLDDIHDKSLGFLASPRRLNVAITRARAILIIIGNPFTLRRDPYWSAVIRYCISNGSCTGTEFEYAFAE